MSSSLLIKVVSNEGITEFSSNKEETSPPSNFHLSFFPLKLAKLLERVRIGDGFLSSKKVKTDFRDLLGFFQKI